VAKPPTELPQCTRIGDVNIVVNMHPDVTKPEGEGTRRTIGCAIFGGFTLAYHEVGENGFIVTSVDCAGGMEVAVAGHRAQAREKGCDVLVWPELTMHRTGWTKSGKTLGGSPLRTALPPILVAGSWQCRGGNSIEIVSI
jgi:hypothetical protein